MKSYHNKLYHFTSRSWRWDLKNIRGKLSVDICSKNVRGFFWETDICTEYAEIRSISQKLAHFLSAVNCNFLTHMEL